MARVTISNLRKAYANSEVIHGIDLDIEDGSFVVFVGPSGCGKSTLLRMIAGLEEVTSGTISIGEREVNEVAPAKRGVAMVFQSYALYPHMTVYNNMAFGLKQAKVDKGEIDQRVRAAADVLQISDYLDRSPRQLSGGQRQRVAIGRAIVRNPEVFLFDEPLSNLDAALRVQTRLEIARLHERLKTTMVYVTHDQVEAMTLADKIVVLRGGYIEQVGSPVELYHRPRNKFVAQFIGSPQMNFFTAPDVSLPLSDTMTLGIRPEHLTPSTAEAALLSGRIELFEHLGEYVIAHLLTPAGTAFTAKLADLPQARPGDLMFFRAEAEALHRFDNESGLRTEG